MKELSNCEYVVYLKNQDRLNSTEEKQVYQLINSLAYPMRTNPLNAKAISDLTQNERGLLYANEAQLILNKIREINPRFNIIQFPKSLQQFYLFAAREKVVLSNTHQVLIQAINNIVTRVIEDHKSSQEENFNKLRMSVSPDFLNDMRTSFNDKMKNFYPDRVIGKDIDYFAFEKTCFDANLSLLTQEIWSELNAALSAEFKLQNSFVANGHNLTHFANIWTERYKTHFSKQYRNTSYQDYDFKYIAENINLLHSVLCFEIECMFNQKTKNLYMIYRGSNMGPCGDRQLIGAKPKHRLSFSNGLCEGIINDNGACAWKYFQCTLTSTEQPNTGYALLFNTNADIDAINIPPLNNVARVFGYGEDFHVRTYPKNNHKLNNLLQKQSFIISDMRAIRLQIDNPQYATRDMLNNYRLSKKIATAAMVEDMHTNPNRYALIPFRG